MSFEKKTWVDRVAEYINRRTLTNEDGTTEIVTVARNEGTISEEGDAFNAETMNDLEERIDTEFTAINESLASQKSTDVTLNSKVTSESMQLLKSGNTVSFFFRFTTSTTIATTGTVFTLPEEYRPFYAKMCTCIDVINNTVYNLAIAANGTVSPGSSTGTLPGSTFIIDTSWII